jgi:hypothetical protein
MLTKADQKKSTPLAGSSVTLLSQEDGSPYSATVMTWANSAESLVVSARVVVGPDAVRHLADGRVWVSVPESGGFTMFGGVARFAGPTSLDITGVFVLLHEPRRTFARTPAENKLTISVGDREPRQLRAVDLSRGGVRLALSNPTDLTLGEKVTVEVHLNDGTSIAASGAVTRIDERAGRATVRFDELPTEDGVRLDMFVLLQLTAAG